MKDGLRPVQLPANQPPRFYRGGAAIAALRGDARTEFGPEDWVASCTTLHGEQFDGLTTLPDGTLLRDAVAAHPANWLGDAHVRAFGAEPALLVKLLDAGQRLPVHCHPSNDFAARHYDSRFGKTEAWIVIGAEEGATVHVGFTEDVAADTVADWVARQDSAAMLAALNPVTVRPGDTVFVPAGVPHAIDAGIFIVELQQPTDLSVTLEWRGFLDDEAGGHLGIGFDTALGCVDRQSWAHRLDELVHPSNQGDLFAHPEFFRAQRLTGGAALDASFGVLVVLAGTGTLRTEKAGDVPLTKGATFVLPHAAGESTLDGEVTVIRCLPPVS
ncbi:class I mannose-6-phosphate isomerase [Actinophytocola sp.]|uniref:class I mannose-6-phosphate isomerase n=1 Tax=Actinophytocola sp. TaxID=1872138 RepID=UPI003899818C